MAPVLVSLLLAGCGGGGGNHPEITSAPTPDLTKTAYVELARGLYADNDPGEGVGEPVLSQKQADCLARGLLDSLKLKGLMGIGVLSAGADYRGRPMSIPTTQSKLWIDALAACADLHDYVFDTVRIGAMATDPDAAAKGSDAAWEEARSCVKQKVNDAAIRAMLLQELSAKTVAGADPATLNTCVAIAFKPTPKTPAQTTPAPTPAPTPAG
jgi:hypothetical protein